MAYLNAEELLVQHFLHAEAEGLLGVHFSTDVPADRPPSFVTFERTGGDSSRFQDHPEVAVQCWASSRHEAAELCGRVKRELNEGFRYHDQVSRLDIGSMYNFPDPDSGHSRYQMLVSFRTSAY